MSVMYFVPDAESIKAAKESNCPLATPRDPAPCKGERCMSWNHKENKPCDGFRGERAA